MADPKNIPDNIVLENSGDGNTVVIDKDDIIAPIKRKIGDYVADITKHNNPPLTNNLTDITLTNPDGNPSPIDDVSKGSATERFVDTFKSSKARKAVGSFNQLSDSSFLEGLEVAKGKVSDKSLPTGDELYQELNDTAGTNSAGQIVTSLKQTLTDNNRFTSQNEYVPTDTRPEEEESNVGNILLQPNLGAHIPRKFPNSPPNAEQVILKTHNLKNLGLQMLLEASGEYYVPEDTDNFGQVVLSKAASTAPGLARIGLRVPVSRFSAAEIASQVNPKFNKESNFPELNGPQLFSYGNTNNPLVPFDAVSSTSSKSAAILLATTVAFLIEELSKVIGNSGEKFSGFIPSTKNLGEIISKDGKPTASPEEKRKKRLGSYLGKDREKENNTILGSLNVVFSPSSFFVAVRTENDYTDCVKRGLEVFFGQGPTGNILNAVLGAVVSTIGLQNSNFDKVTETPGYYNVILRMLVKSTTEVVLGSINSIFGFAGAIAGNGGGATPLEQEGTVGALDIDRQIGLSADPTNLFNVINSLKDAKLVKFTNIMATLGDLNILTEGGTFDSTMDSVKDNIDGIPYPNPAALIKKSRLSEKLSSKYADKSAFASNTLRSLYILPETFGTAETKFTGTNSSFKVLQSNFNFKTMSKNRLNSEDVTLIETELDAYYMPFYFQDLRTNEIISFHAFVETVTDSFDADYVENEGYGRIGKSYGYKNTNRSIACSFRVISTNKEDFSDMWYKINKLVMLLYPQYTAGRQVNFVDGSGVNNKFIQPFSQLIGSSPMIRLRLGDLLKTNFSDFDMAKLFGVGTNQFNITGDSTSNNNSSVPDEFAKKYNDIKERQLSYDFDVSDKFILNDNEAVGSRMSKYNILKIEFNDDTIIAFNPQGNVNITVKGKIQNSGLLYEVDFEPKSQIENVKRIIADFTGIPFGLAITPDSKFIEQKALQNNPLTDQGSLAAAVSPEDKNDEVQKFQDFFNPDNNPIVKAFDSVAGQGLAGFIKRLSFDWSDAMWDTEGLNHRAPMWCKIDIDFAPVHDISPGLDSSGNMIGAIYNVGMLMNLMKIKRKKEIQASSTTNMDYSKKKNKAATLNKTNGDNGNNSSLLNGTDLNKPFI